MKKWCFVETQKYRFAHLIKTNFDVVTGVLQGDKLTLYLFIICLDYVPWTSIDLIKENGFMLKKTRSRWYPAEAITSQTIKVRQTRLAGYC